MDNGKCGCGGPDQTFLLSRRYFDLVLFSLKVDLCQFSWLSQTSRVLLLAEAILLETTKISSQLVLSLG